MIRAYHFVIGRVLVESEDCAFISDNRVCEWAIKDIETIFFIVLCTTADRWFLMIKCIEEYSGKCWRLDLEIRTEYQDLRSWYLESRKRMAFDLAIILLYIHNDPFKPFSNIQSLNDWNEFGIDLVRVTMTLATKSIKEPLSEQAYARQIPGLVHLRQILPSILLDIVALDTSQFTILWVLTSRYENLFFGTTMAKACPLKH